MIGRFADQCQRFRLVIDLILPEIGFELIPDINLWRPFEGKRRAYTEDVPSIDLQNLLDVALGGALLRVSEQMQETRSEDIEDAAVEKLASSGAVDGLNLGMRSFQEVVGKTSQIMNR